MTIKKYFGIALMSTLWLLNPVFLGCSVSPEFTFSESDMIAVLNSLSSQTWTTDVDGVTYEITVDLEQSDEEYVAFSPEYLTLSSAAACGTRSFTATADACLETSRLHITGTVDVFNTETQELTLDTIELTGFLDIFGYDLNNGILEVKYESGSMIWDSNDGKSFDLALAEW